MAEILKNIEAVLFDLDGTLVDSMWMWRNIDIEYLARFGIEMPSNLQEEIAGISVTPVSYTHLDVYKRQNQNSVNLTNDCLHFYMH